MQKNSFHRVTDCVCPQDVVTYECTVCGLRLATAWEGTALGSCSGGEIALTNRDFMDPIRTIICSGGTIAAHGIIVEDGCFTSQLNVTFNITALQGRSVRCSVDNGTHAFEVGRHILTLSTGTTNIILIRRMHFSLILYNHYLLRLSMACICGFSVCLLSTMNIMIVRCWFCIFYEAAKPRVELQNQHLTTLVAVTTDPLTY